MASLPEDRVPSYFIRPDGTKLAYHQSQATSSKVGPGVVFLGGFHSDMQGLKATDLEAFAQAKGHAFLRFDYRGHGQSDGAFEAHVIGDWIDDAFQIFDQLTDGPQIVVGSSMGGWIATHLALRFPERIAGVVTIAAAPDYTQDMLDGLLPPEIKAEIFEKGVWVRPSDYDWEGYPITRALLEDGAKHLVLNAPIPVACPVRLLHGTKDVDVAWQRSQLLMEQMVGKDISLTLVKDGDHRLSDEKGLALIRRTVESLL